MKEIQLTKGKVALVDDEDYEELSKHKWYASTSYEGLYYAKRGAPKNGSPCQCFMHREILSVPDGLLADHIDGDSLNNTRHNLRIATPFGNTCNRRIQRNNTTGYCGVRKTTGGYGAEIKIQGKKQWLGTFGTIGEAIEARYKAEQLLFGAYARQHKRA